MELHYLNSGNLEAEAFFQFKSAPGFTFMSFYMNGFNEVMDIIKGTMASLSDSRTASNTQYSMQDAGLSAFSVFFMQSPSFLAAQQAMEKHQSGCTSYHHSAITPIALAHSRHPQVDTPRHCKRGVLALASASIARAQDSG